MTNPSPKPQWGTHTTHYVSFTFTSSFYERALSVFFSIYDGRSKHRHTDPLPSFRRQDLSSVGLEKGKLRSVLSIILVNGRPFRPTLISQRRRNVVVRNILIVMTKGLIAEVDQIMLLISSSYWYV